MLHLDCALNLTHNRTCPSGEEVLHDQDRRIYRLGDLLEEFPHHVLPALDQVISAEPSCRDWLAEQGIADYASFPGGAYRFKSATHATMFKLRWV